MIKTMSFEFDLVTRVNEVDEKDNCYLVEVN